MNPDDFRELTRRQALAQTEATRLGAARARWLAQYQVETGLSYANIGAEVGLKRGTVQQLVERGRELLPRRFEIVATNGAEIEDDTATWGIVTGGGDMSFVTTVPYEDGDDVTDAIARFQRDGDLPAGEATVRREDIAAHDDYWIHEDHQCVYVVEITPE